MDTNTKIEFTKPIEKQTFQTTLSIPIDSSVNIKKLLSVDAYTYDEKMECGNAKAIYTGRVGVKILYVDTDNVTNTLTDSQAISETIVDSAITSDCFIIFNSCVNTNVLSTDGTLKLVCEIGISPTLYLNLTLPTSPETFNNMIVKKSEITAATIKTNVNTSFNFMTNLETRDNIEKILCYNSYFVPTCITPSDNSATIEGKIYSKLLFETTENDCQVIKELCDTFNLKSEVEIPNCSNDSILNINAYIDSSKTQISTEKDNDENIANIDHTIILCGIISNMLRIETCDDIYSTENEIDVSTSNREYCQSIETCNEDCLVFGEVTIGENESAIDNIVSNLNIVTEVTKGYVKSEALCVEGIISSQVLYLDENKNYVMKNAELPFIIDTKIHADENTTKYIYPYIVNCKAKAKRGAIIELEYTVNICCDAYTYNNKTLIDNISLGKPLDFSQYDYQIFLARPDETKWDLAKRIKISPEDLEKCNRELADTMTGGEKIVIKR